MNRLLTSEKPGRWLALFEGFLVAIIWASSSVLIKMGLAYMGSLTLAGVRYFLAFLLLLPLVARRGSAGGSLSLRSWVHLFLMGLGAYTVGNGTLYLGLKYIPATTGSFLLSFIPLLVLFLSILWLREAPTLWQIAGLLISLGGSWLFFSPGLSAGEPLGIGTVVVGLLGFALFSTLGREIARERQVDILVLSAFPLGFGGGLLLLLALPLEGMPGLSAAGWGIVLWLAIVNTAFAYVLYNHSLQVLTALEINMIFNLSPLGTAVISWFLLGERLALIQIVGMVVVIAGVAVVQGGRRH
jgi:drug/metabolite transporter (DMT)-like permease